MVASGPLEGWGLQEWLVEEASACFSPDKWPGPQGVSPKPPTLASPHPHELLNHHTAALLTPFMAGRPRLSSLRTRGLQSAAIQRTDLNPRTR